MLFKIITFQVTTEKYLVTQHKAFRFNSQNGRTTKKQAIAIDDVGQNHIFINTRKPNAKECPQITQTEANDPNQHLNTKNQRHPAEIMSVALRCGARGG